MRKFKIYVLVLIVILSNIIFAETMPVDSSIQKEDVSLETMPIISNSSFTGKETYTLEEEKVREKLALEEEQRKKEQEAMLALEEKEENIFYDFLRGISLKIYILSVIFILIILGLVYFFRIDDEKRFNK